MLNLTYVFDDAIDALKQHGDFLAINALSPTVFLMQCDVINHYRYALYHYMPLSLKEPFLQDSSIGTPYEKWAKFTNSDFNMLSKRVDILLRFTVRLIHEIDKARVRSALDTASFPDEAQTLIEQMGQRSRRYQEPMCDLSYHDEKIGLHVKPRNQIVMTRLSYTRNHSGKLTIEHKDGITTNKLITIDEGGNEHTQIISDEAARERMKVLKGETIDISDRRVINTLQKEGQAEVAELESRNKQFGKACDVFLKKRSVMQPFDNMFEEWMQ